MMNNKSYTQKPIYSKYVSKTEYPTYLKPTHTDSINIENEDLEIVDYPYIGIGKKPANNHIPTEDQLEKIIGG